MVMLFFILTNSLIFSAYNVAYGRQHVGPVLQNSKICRYALLLHMTKMERKSHALRAVVFNEEALRNIFLFRVSDRVVGR